VRRADGRPLAVPVWMTRPEAAHANVISTAARLPLHVLLELHRISVTGLFSLVHNVRKEDHDGAAPPSQTPTTTVRKKPPPFTPGYNFPWACKSSYATPWWSG